MSINKQSMLKLGEGFNTPNLPTMRMDGIWCTLYCGGGTGFRMRTGFSWSTRCKSLVLNELQFHSGLWMFMVLIYNYSIPRVYTPTCNYSWFITGWILWFMVDITDITIGFPIGFIHQGSHFTSTGSPDCGARGLATHSRSGSRLAAIHSRKT